ncbi:E3 ubiquitin-protein ligase TRIM39-like [Notolabrus celidotus]|uniref:E3 ubiquitin-protein ligase TRIM39-like n=1 Tax=Notolabrus celidotus TaxID=1203425 RepID=UPI00149068F5|nr:E3 ubiquitin-protein ligase TRIM39-like [Notolabrus celidotus]XP_034528975.1 E3 ubiquitin-protein ligase TRIM39-like [Notolabrus celidotus]
MASASVFTLEGQPLCSICLHEFTEPVSTPCGHNYCKACITAYWDTTDRPQCPLCKKQFHTRPQLQVNTEFRDMVGRFNNTRLRSEDNTLAKPGEVPCDICPGPKFKAQKTCLLCLSSYCQIHLELHQGVASRKNHQLIDPVTNLEDRVCKKHDRMFEFFCLVDQMCVCFMCLNDEHAMHRAIPLQQEITARKARLVDVVAEMKTMEKAKSRSIAEIKYSVEQSRIQAAKELEEIAEVFTDLILSLRRSQIELTDLIKGKQEAAEKQARDHLTKLEQEVTELVTRRSEMKELLRTDDDIKLLLGCPSLDFAAHGNQMDPLSHFNPPVLPELSDLSPQTYVGMVRKCVAQMEKTFSNEMEMLIHEVSLSDGCEVAKPSDQAEKPMTDGFIEEVWNTPQDKLMMIQQCNAMDVTLDAYTAHLNVMVSGDGKQLRVRDGQSFLSSLFGNRVLHNTLVLGADGFTSGRFYYQVRVSGCDSWILGVAKESINRDMISLPEDGYWTFCGFHTLSHHRETFFGNIRAEPVRLRQTPKTVGVFVDYEKGEVSFYDVDTRTLIYSYTGCNFFETQPALKAFLFSMAGAPLSSRSKLFPSLGIYGNDQNNVLEITPVAH